MDCRNVNLIEREPYNCLAQKNKKCGATKFKYLRNVGNRFKKPAKMNSISVGPVWCHRHTDFFRPAHSPVGQKTSLINFKHKITTSANYTDGISTGLI